MLELVQSLRDAPVMHLFVLVGFLLVVFGAGAKSPLGKLDVPGRILLASCGLGLLGAASMIFLGIRSAREAPPEDRTPPGGGTQVVAPAPLPPHAPPGPPPVAATAPGAPATAQPHHGPAVTTFSLPSPTALSPAGAPPAHEIALPAAEGKASWGCGETATATASLRLPSEATFRSAVVEVADVDNAKALRRLVPRFDASTRTVTGAVEFTGLDKVFFNCPGGGHATIRLVVRAVP
ncbi:MAG: hypothetical protein RBU36_18455 [Thermoanaerobaculia bacterium]|jgi:hypothetical protein|nr:hypothetical protein [Thermoanaerobaculia bacterium]